MKLIVGLGNPGAGYQMNRHNVGFMAVDLIQQQQNFPDWSAKFKGLYTKRHPRESEDPFSSFNKNLNQVNGKAMGPRLREDDAIILLKPQTYMNLSGQSVQACMTFFKLTLDDLWVVHDDIELPLGDVKTKTGGSAKGHNGLRSIDQCVGQDYHRVRLGVGRPAYGAVADYVLSNFSKDELLELDKMLGAASAIIFP